MTQSSSIDAVPGWGDFSGRIWLNTAHQGAIPLRAVAAAHEAVAWKASPSELTQARFDDTPQRLREAIARLVKAPADEIVLANSASYGLNVIAQAYPWQAGDEIVVMEGDFPSDILPWLLAAEQNGARVVRIRPRRHVVEPDELAAAITPRTRLFCCPWVHSLSGFAVDLTALGAICRDRGVTFVLNASQALGVRPIDLRSAPVDALVCVGFKWLCGPYGTGFAWISAELMAKLKATKAYWLSMMTAQDLAGAKIEVELKPRSGARSYDIFGTANFFNAKPLTEAVSYLTELGIERIAAHGQALVDRFVTGLDAKRYRIDSPTEPGERRSTLIFFSDRDPARNPEVHRALAENGIDIAFRAGSLRLAPHLYNSSSDIDRALAVLNARS